MKKILGLLCAGSFLITGCMDDVLNKKPIGREFSDVFFTKENNTNEAVNAIYDPMNRVEAYSRFYYAVGECRADLAKVAGANSLDQGPAQQIMRYSQLSDNTNLRSFWLWAYTGAQRATTVIEGLKDIKDYPTGDYLSQAYFLRAVYYFDLVRVFGPVPLVIKPLTADQFALGNRTSDDDNVGSKQVELIYKQIVLDLQSAARLGSPISASMSRDGHVGRAAALALLSKVYAYMASSPSMFKDNKSEYWTKSAACADTVISSGAYELVADYHTLFTVNGKNSKESIFEIQCVAGADYDIKSEGSIRGIDQSYRYVTYPAGGRSGTVGYGLNCPTASFVAMFDVENTDGSKGYKFDSKGTNFKKDWDSRLDLVAKPEDSILNNDKGLQWCKFSYDSWKMEINEPFYSRKQEPNWNEWGVKSQSTGINWIYYRYADLLLLRAEAASNLGDASTALKYVNMVRERARKSKTASVTVSGGYAVRTLTEGKYPASLSAVTLEDVYKERCLELGGEYHRFFDLVRLGKASTVLGAVEIKDSKTTTMVRKFSSRDERLPIPVSAISEGRGNVLQNPGY